jgi:hypothetical protein
VHEPGDLLPVGERGAGLRVDVDPELVGVLGVASS